MSTAESLPRNAAGLAVKRQPLVAVSSVESPAGERGGLRGWHRDYVHLLRWIDAGVIAGSLILAKALRFGSVAGATMAGQPVDYSVVSAVIGVLWLGALTMYRSRDSRILGYGIEEYQRVCTATLVLFGSVAVLSAAFKLDIARGYLLLALPLGIVGLAVGRRVARHVMTGRWRKEGLTRAVLAVGDADSVRSLTEELARHSEQKYTVVGVAQPYADEIVSAVVSSAADTVAITSGHLSAGEIRDLSWELERLDIDLVVTPGILDVSGPRLMIRQVGGLPLIHIDKPQYDGAKHFGKRLFDICFSMMVLLIAAPLLEIAAMMIRLDDRGPVFYLAERIGLDGRPFRMLKFRTMAVGADQMRAEIAHLDQGNGVLFKIRSDPRVTRVGKFLRRYSIDEIPQFINVLRREMSVVGPRPPLPSEVSEYDRQMRRRLLVRPGITGLWQISGRSDLSWEESIRLDLSYVENWSMVTDLVIAAKTVGAVYRGSGAY